jgi:hypothetical protein
MRNLKSVSMLLASLMLLPVTAASAFTLETAVTCKEPIVWIQTGLDGSTPRVTIQCLGGSSVPGIVYFAWPMRTATDETLALLIERTVAGLVLEHGINATLTLYSELSNTSGNAWGCGSANCRILGQLIGY